MGHLGPDGHERAAFHGLSDRRGAVEKEETRKRV